MRRTEVLDGVRMLKFRDVFGRCEQGRLSKLEAAELLGINERTFRRWHAPKSLQTSIEHFPQPATLISVLVGDGAERRPIAL